MDIDLQLGLLICIFLEILGAGRSISKYPWNTNPKLQRGAQKWIVFGPS